MEINNRMLITLVVEAIVFLTITPSEAVGFPPWNQTHLYLSGNASIQGDKLPLTPKRADEQGFVVGRVMYNASMDLTYTSYMSTVFTFSMSKNGSNGYDGDGFAFVMAEDIDLGSTPAESGTDSTGFLGVFSNKTNLNGNATKLIVAVEFDTWRNAEFQDADDNHIGIDVNSIISANKTGPNELFEKHGIRLDSGSVIKVWITYDRGSEFLEVYAANNSASSLPFSPILTYHGLDVGNRSFYFGFTGARASLVMQNNTLLSWTIDQLPVPSPTGSAPKSAAVTDYIAAIAGLFGAIAGVGTCVTGVICYRQNANRDNAINIFEINYFNGGAPPPQENPQGDPASPTIDQRITKRSMSIQLLQRPSEES